MAALPTHVFRIGLALAAAVAVSGCWTDACVEPPSPYGFQACHEQVSGVLVDLWSDPESNPNAASCAGTYHSIQTCADLGYSQDCGACWAKPGVPCTYASCP